MAVDSKGLTVQQHAQKVHDELVASGKIKPDGNAGVGDQALPPFSAGTATIDPNTGKPVGKPAPPPEFGDGTHIVPEGDKGAAPVGDKGKPVAEPPAKPAEGSQPAAEAGDRAAEAAAADLIEWEEFEFEDPDLSKPDAVVKFPVRVPKQYLEPAKRGYGRRAALDRQMSFLKNAEPRFKKLVETGQFNTILGMLDACFENEDLGRAVWGIYERFQRHEPLLEAAAKEAAAPAGEGAAGTPTGMEEIPAELLADPVLGPALRAQQARFSAIQRRLDEQDARENAARERNQQTVAEQRQVSEAMMAAHQDIAKMYQGQYRPEMGPSDPAWQEVIDYARESGYTQVYGLRGGIVLAAQAVAQIHAERVAAGASPAATAIQEAEARRMELARREASGSAGIAGAGATGSTPARAREYVRPERMKTLADGTQVLKPAEEYLAEALAARKAATPA